MVKSDKSPPPLFGTMVVYGVGLIGGSLAAACKRGRLVERVLGISRAGTISKALELGVIDEGFERGQAAQALSRADLVVLGGPVRVIIDQLSTIGPLLKAGTVVTDVGSTKRAVVKAALEHLPDSVHFVGGHPMAGAETTGVESADPFLFQNAVYVICPPRESDRVHADRFSLLAQALGARVLIISPENHDRIAATISHLPQLVAVGMMNLAAGFNDQDGDTLKLAAGGFRDITRIASSSFGVWSDILETNSDQIRQRIDSMISSLESLRKIVGTGEMAAVFERAARSRALIHKDAKGFLSPLFEVVVTAPDEVGVIERLAVGLAGERINIKDIEVLKVRQGEGGTIKLGFATQQDRARAIRILNSLNLPAHARD